MALLRKHSSHCIISLVQTLRTARRKGYAVGTKYHRIVFGFEEDTSSTVTHPLLTDPAQLTFQLILGSANLLLSISSSERARSLGPALG
jgi:hypothetical protein